ncbi:MAG: metallophosphoesterase [Deltaproteobacteria bacterium]|nr:metallophosphoesterase [Myxococcales bacterium]MDP3221294.1 metallophosphoesterase [Deltaproteobacteria bacterium]
MDDDQRSAPPTREFAEALSGGAAGERAGLLGLGRKDPRSLIAVRHFAGPDSFVGQLDGLRIAHLTDIHVGRVTPMAIQNAAVALTNEANPDLVVITGDFVCHSQKYLDQLEALVRGFKAPVIGVLGNHDYWSGAAEVRAALKRGGVEVLDNAHTTVTLRHQRLQVLGLDDAYTGHADRARALKGLDARLPTLGLSHIAEEADRLWPHGVGLVLSGHTHAGQVTLARLHELAIGHLAGHRYVHGLYGTRRRGVAPGGAVYVGAGIGASVIPLRLGERGRREVAIFELGMALGTLDEHHGEQAPLKGRAPAPELVAKRNAAVHKKQAKRAKQ